jgi:hypothetical protein
MSELKEVFDNDDLLNGYLENVKLADFRAEVRKLVEKNGSTPNSDYAKCADEILLLDLADEVINKRGCIISILCRHFA